MTDFLSIPIHALSLNTKRSLSIMLNSPKVIPNENNLPRDWRCLTVLISDKDKIPLLSIDPDPTAQIFKILEHQHTVLNNLWELLETVNRWDVLDDLKTLFQQDAESYYEQLEKSKTSASHLETQNEAQIITTGDIYRSKQGLGTQHYDAFLLYADEDAEFATEMIENLENKYKLKLCLKDRDLVGGITFEHEAIMTLISERCNRLIIIVSSNFLKSSANKFFLNYAQALGIEKGQRKIVPCLYEKCQLPMQLSYMFILDYNRKTMFDFWGRLRDSIQPTLQGEYSQKISTRNESSLSCHKTLKSNNDDNSKVKEELVGEKQLCDVEVSECHKKSESLNQFLLDIPKDKEIYSCENDNWSKKDDLDKEKNSDTQKSKVKNVFSRINFPDLKQLKRNSNRYTKKNKQKS